ncbi:MAG: hypothetical protein LDL33_01145 [Desulfomonile sp.]|nr:hypothetical protein [Desulfomonile sp.]
MQSDLFVIGDLSLLMGKEEEWCVSIYMPTHRVTPRVQENQIRFKNLLKKAEEKLAGVGAKDRDLLMEPARRLSEDRPFWHHQSDGLALFLSRDLARPYRLPIKFEELVVVTDRFHTKPILPLLTGDGRFYVLALSQNDVRLLLCTKYHFSEVELPGVPRSLEEALRYDENEKPLQLHAHTSSGGGRQSATFHGHGVGIDDAKDRIRRFFQEVDRGLQKILREERAPLVIASVDYLVPIFKQATAYPRVLDQPVSGNPEEVAVDALHKKAVDIVVPYFESDLRKNKARFRELANTGKTASRLEEVVRAAYHGRVDVLFVPIGVHLWGEFDSSTEEVTKLQPGAPGAGDLLDYAAAQTLLNGGTVYAVEMENMPDRAEVAAILRY